MKEVCIRCNGTGEYMGNGFMMTNCLLCVEKDEFVAPSLDKINRKSKSYHKAIRDIMDSNPSITRQDAVRMFDEAYQRS